MLMCQPWCVAALMDPSADNVTMELTNGKASSAEGVAPLPEQLKGMLQGIKPDGSNEYPVPSLLGASATCQTSVLVLARAS